MLPQHVADRSSRSLAIEAFQPQTAERRALGCFFDPISDIVAAGCTQAAGTLIKGQVGPTRPTMSINCDRRSGCQRASKQFSRSVWSPSWRLVASAQKKNTSWSSPSPSRSSRPTPVNTSNRISGQAVMPVPPRLPLPATACTLFKQGGVSC